MAENNSEALVLTPEEARRLLRCSRGVIYEGIRRGTIPSIRIGPRKIVIPRQRFYAWLNGGGGGNDLQPKE
jgi:excisionase family DNA binding protein